MKLGKWQFSAISGVIVAVVGLTLLVNAYREPSYNGKSLSEWLEEREAPPEGGLVKLTDEAREAVREIGPDAIPWLFHWLQQADGVEEDQHTGNPFNKCRARAYHGFLGLGEEAKPAVPRLVELALSEDNANVQYVALASLEHHLPAVVEILNEKVKSNDGEVRYNVVFVAGFIAIPGATDLLSSTLSDPDVRVRSTAVRSLGFHSMLGLHLPQETVDAIKLMSTDDDDPEVRLAAKSTVEMYLKEKGLNDRMGAEEGNH